MLPLGANQAFGQRAIRGDGRVAETASLGEASNTSGAGAGEGIAAGSAGWVTLDLAPAVTSSCATFPAITPPGCTPS